jgi:hypothetical protein
VQDEKSAVDEEGISMNGSPEVSRVASPDVMDIDPPGTL